MSKETFPTPEAFCLNVPLYKEYSVDAENIGSVSKLIRFDGHLDTYCPQCESHTVFNCKTTNKEGWIDIDSWYYQPFLTVFANCSRDKAHLSIYIFKVSRDSGIQKIGQHPSTADSNLYDAKKYSKILNTEDFRAFTKSIGLAAHGIGAGALVYLRRIFESLIKEAHSAAAQELNWDEKAYHDGRMQDRVKLLKNYLPSFLVEHHRIYAVLSNGVHELSESQCLDFFPILKMSIELILDQKILEAERAKKTDEVSQFLSKFDQIKAKSD